MIYIGADHRGFLQKQEIITRLREQGIDLIDLGATEYNKDDDYPLIAIKVAEKCQNGDRGIIMCGSGVGVVVAANKVKMVRAGLGISEKQVFSGRNDDDMNVLCLSADGFSTEENLKMIEVFLNTPFGSEERYIRRINQIKTYETTQR